MVDRHDAHRCTEAIHDPHRAAAGFPGPPVGSIILNAITTVRVPVKAYEATSRGMVFRVLVYPPTPRRVSLLIKAEAMATTDAWPLRLAYEGPRLLGVIVPVAFVIDTTSAELLIAYHVPALYRESLQAMARKTRCVLAPRQNVLDMRESAAIRRFDPSRPPEDGDESVNPVLMGVDLKALREAVAATAMALSTFAERSGEPVTGP